MGKQFDGKLTISRVSNNREPDYICIRVEDRISATEVIEVTVALEDFAKAVTGFAYQNCRFEHNTSCVGKKRELKEITIARPPLDRAKAIQVAKQRCSLYEVDGWCARYDDALNPHNWTDNDQVRVTMIRFVDPPAEPRIQEARE